MLAATTFHGIVALGFSVAGKLSLFPGAIDRNGIVLPSDNPQYYLETVWCARILANQGVAAFLRAPSPFHVKAYGLCFAAFSPLLGESILSFEPLNVAIYLLILFVVYKLSGVLSSRPASLASVVIVAVWPSFLFHTTQLFRDPIVMAATATLVLVMASWLVKAQSWRKVIVLSLAGALAATVVWVVRSGMRDVILANVIVGAVLLLIKQLVERRFLLANTLAAGIVVGACVFLPSVISPYSRKPIANPFRTSEAPPWELEIESAHAPSSQTTMTSDLGKPAGTKIGRLRKNFLGEFPDATSNIDSTVRLDTKFEVVRFLPRALAIGLFAPFPRMWFEETRNTLSYGKIVAGCEMFVIYLFQILAVVGIWKMRDQWQPWYLLIVILIGAISLGLVVANVGALYRMRYSFWILLIVLAVEGASRLLDVRRERRASNATSSFLNGESRDRLLVDSLILPDDRIQ